jgi:5-methyltetrahydropteroyltriglutamate--homocysteine methyltransferase
MSVARRFPASVVGSLPRPLFVRELLDAEVGMAPEAYNARMNAAIRFAVAMQEHAGLDVVTDGEWRRRSYIGVIAELAHGFTLGVNPADGRPWTIVTDRLSEKEAGFIAREAAFLRDVTDRRVKITMPAPALLGERLWVEGASDKAYPTREAFVSDCVPVLRREIELLAESGADIIQIDDPHLCLFVDPHVQNSYPNWRKAADFAVDMVNAVVDGIKGPRIALHLCKRAGARVRGEHDHRGGYESIVEQKFREDLEIGFGCINVLPGIVDSVEAVVARVEEALGYVDPGRLTLNPDCGFAPGSAAIVDLDEVYRKLRVEVQAATVLRERFA